MGRENETLLVIQYLRIVGVFGAPFFTTRFSQTTDTMTEIDFPDV